jgi:hypothetical protein
MLWPHFRHLGMRVMILLRVCGAGRVARAEQGAAHSVKVGARRAKPAHTAMWARRTLTVCDHLIDGDVQEQIRRCVFVQHCMTQGTVLVEL